MSKPNEERDIYYIPPNFLASGRLFGGMIRARNAIEACVLVLLTGIPIIKLPMSLTVRIIILCLLPLPLGIFGIIGFEGDSLSEFAINWVRWFIHRRNLYRSDVTIPETARKQKKRIWEQEATKPPEELGIRIKQPRKKRKRPAKTEKQLNKNNRKMVPSHKKQVTYSEDFVPVKDIRNGIIEMEDGRYIRVLEVEPINFLLRSTSEQKNIVASFASWMKISPIKIQIKVLTKKADIGKHLSTIERDMESESNPKCRELQLDYYRLIQTIGSREAITRRFLVIFEYEAVTNRKPEYSEIVSALETTVQTARQYFLHCDNAVVTHDDENAFLLEILYTIFNRSTCEVKTVEQRIGELQLARRDTDITVPVSLKSVLAPDSIDLTHGSYVVMDGVYHAYLIVPSDGYNPRVVAGWTSILVNAGEGIDVDFYFSREPKERIQATKNLITGTRYLNIEGMLPFENMVADYVKENGNHVMYRVTPIFEGDNFLANGVLMEGYSVEDKGAGVSYCVFAYNVQPGIEIDYATGESKLADSAQQEEQKTATVTPTPSPEPEKQEPATGSEASQADYILNTNTKKFHYPTCSSVNDMKEKNKQEFFGTRDEAISNGYSPCGRCKP